MVLVKQILVESMQVVASHESLSARGTLDPTFAIRVFRREPREHVVHLISFSEKEPFTRGFVPIFIIAILHDCTEGLKGVVITGLALFPR